MSTTFTVPFHNQDLLLIEHNERPYVALKPIVEGMGLDWKSQYAKIKANGKRFSTMVLNTTVAKDGKSREMIAMPLMKLPAFMASVHASRVKEELRPAIEMYQEECDNVLADYWFKGQATNPRAETISPAQQRMIQELVSELSKDDKAYAKRYGAIKTHFNIAKYDQLLATDIDAAFEIIEGVIVNPPSLGEHKTMTTAEVAGKDEHLETLLRKAAYLDGKIIIPQIDMMNLIRSHHAAMDAQRELTAANDKFMEAVINMEKECNVTLELKAIH